MSFYHRNKLDASIVELEAQVPEREKPSPPRSIRVAANAFVIVGGEALLVEFEDASGPHFNFPGGGVEAGETLEQAVVREVPKLPVLPQVSVALLDALSAGSAHPIVIPNPHA